jgi:tetratricopeptide (TPR) repeat protein
MMRLEDGEQLSLNTWKGFQRLAQAEPSDKTLYRDLLNAQATWIWALTLRGEYEKAIPLKRQNIADFERAFGADDLETLTEWGNLANMMLVVGNYAEMEIIARQTRDRLQRAGLGDRQETFAITVMLAQSLLCQDQAPEALSILQEAHPRAVRALGPDAPQTLLVQYTLARALAEQGALEEAERLAREALDLQLRADNPNHWNTGNMLLVLGRLLVAKGQFDEAQTCLQRACSLFQASHFTHKSQKLAVAENLLGAIHLARTNYFEATRLIEPNAEQFVTPRGILAISPGERRDAFKQILNLYRALDKPDKVETWQRRIEHFAKWTDNKQPGPVRLSTHDPARSSP